MTDDIKEESIEGIADEGIADEGIADEDNGKEPEGITFTPNYFLQRQNYLVMILELKHDAAFRPVIEMLINAHVEEEKRKLTAQFAAAMVAAQAEMEPVFADEENERTQVKYASLHAIDEKIRSIYTRHGFAPTFGEDIRRDDPDHVTLELELMHSCGLTKCYEMRLPADGKGSQGKVNMTRTHAAGSAFTYAQRYMLKLAFNIVTVDRDDDDGTAAGTACISHVQLTQLKAAIAEAGADEQKLKAYYKVGEIAELPALAFEDAMGILNMKKAEK